MMLTHIQQSFKFFIRSAKRHRLQSFINLLGLVIGTASFVFITSYVAYESSFDQYHPNAERAFRVSSQKVQDGLPQSAKASASVALAPHIQETIPDIEAVARVHILDADRQIIRIEGDTEKVYTETGGYHAETDFFKVFGTPLLQGNAETALEAPNSIVLTQSLAKKYFGDENPLGKTVTLTDDFEMLYDITGVVADVPANAHFQYDFLISFSTFQKQRPNWRWSAWDWDYFHTYVLLKPTADPAQITDKINSSVSIIGKEVFQSRGYTMNYALMNVQDIHLQSDLDRELSMNNANGLLAYLNLIALFVLVLAWVNYINLATAKSALRAKEIGIRKVAGSTRSSLVIQLMSESFFFNTLATGLGLGVLMLASPYLADVTNFSFHVSQLNPTLPAIAIVVGAFGAGFYPAMIMSNMKPAQILKGNFSSSKKGLVMRKVLVCFQFILTFVLFIGTVGINRQIEFLRDRNLGIELNEVLVVNLPNLRTDSFWNSFDMFKSRLEQRSDISLITASNQVPGSQLNHVELFKLQKQLPQEASLMKFVWTDFNYFDLFKIETLHGKVFDRERPGDHRNGVIFNETAAKLLGITDLATAVNQPVTWIHSWGEEEAYTIVGVVKDFDQEALDKPQPMAFLLNRSRPRWLESNFASIKITGGSLSTTLKSMEAIYSEVFPNDSFDYFFLDQHFDRQYQSDQRFGKIFGLFSGMAIIISNLGLFGLISFILNQRKREIGMRRVLGARFQSILKLITLQFSTQLILAMLIAIPGIYLILRYWVSGFAYQAPFSVPLFVFPILSVTILILVIVLHHTYRVSRTNPTENLRDQ